MYKIETTQKKSIWWYILSKKVYIYYRKKKKHLVIYYYKRIMCQIMQRDSRGNRNPPILKLKGLLTRLMSMKWRTPTNESTTCSLTISQNNSHKMFLPSTSRKMLQEKSH
jgi:hypothetical protein